MKKLFNYLVDLFSPRYKVIERVELSTGVVCKHILDKRRKVIRVEVE